MQMSSSRDVIAELINTYAERIDEGDFEGLADLFADATLTTEGMEVVACGRDDVLALYASWTRRYPDDGTPKTKHVMSNLIVKIDEDAGTAASRSYFTVLQAVPGEFGLQPIVAGRYRATYERIDGSWRFRTFHIVLDLLGDLTHHGTSPLEPS